MKIKILTSCSGINYSFRIGETVDVRDEIAADLIGAGYAEDISIKSEAKQEVEPKAQTAAKQKAGVKKDAQSR